MLPPSKCAKVHFHVLPFKHLDMSLYTLFMNILVLYGHIYGTTMHRCMMYLIIEKEKEEIQICGNMFVLYY